MMTSKERVLATFNRTRSDRVPMWCGMSPEFLQKSMEYLSVNSEEDVLLRFHDDFRRIYTKYKGPDIYNSHINQRLGRKDLNIFGIERSGYGYGQPLSHPLANASLDKIEAYPWPDPDWVDVSSIREDARRWQGEFAVMCGEWSPFWHDAIDLMGMENLMISMYEEPEKVHAILGHLSDYYYEATKRILEEGAGQLDIFFCGNDFGSQTGPLLGKELFCEFLAPVLKRLCALAHDAGLFTQMHVCGSFRLLMPAMIECGVDALQSLQPSVYNMNPAELKAEFGHKIILNGCIDSVDVLINSHPDTVREVTKSTVLHMKQGGGYILSPSHDYLLDTTPVENVLAMYDAGIEFGRY